MTQEVFIPGPMPGMNELIGAANRSRFQYAAMKKSWTEVVHIHALASKLRRAESPVAVSFIWRERDRRRDIDNVAGGGSKLVLDGLVKAGVLAGDGWRDVYSIDHLFQVDAKNPGVLVRIGPAVPF